MSRNLNQEEIYYPSSSGFYFAFGVGEDLDPKIGFFSVSQVIAKSRIDKNQTSLEIKAMPYS